VLDAALYARLTHQLSSFRAWVADADPRDLEWTPPSGKWSALLNLAHVGRHHEVTQERIARVLREDAPVFPRYDEAEDPSWERWKTLGATQVWAALDERRTALVSAVGALAPEQLARTGVHAKFGPMDVPRWLEFFLVHEAHHLYVALQRLAEARSARQ
jgi:DinB superfamily